MAALADILAADGHADEWSDLLEWPEKQDEG
jgi:hypothetical protein